MCVAGLCVGMGMGGIKSCDFNRVGRADYIVQVRLA